MSYSRVFSVKPEPVRNLYARLSTIPDPRYAQGRRHPLALMLTLAILALCCGQLSYQALEEWVVNYQTNLEKSVPTLAGHLIDASTFHRVFARLDKEELELVLGKWLQEVLPISSQEPIALDGKTLSGINCHLLSAFAHQALGVLFELGTDSKGKELILAPSLLDHIPVNGHVITADALHAQKSFCQKITDYGGGYCLTVKGNQEKLEEDIKLFFNDLPCKANVAKASKQIRAKGRLSIYTAITSSDLNDYLAWPGLSHIWQLKREVTDIKTGRTTIEVAVGIARLLNEENVPEQIIDLVNGHWSIENRLHRMRDVLFLEDSSTIRKGSAPQIFAALKNLVISIYHRASVRYFPTAFRRFLACPEELFKLLGLTNLAV